MKRIAIIGAGVSGLTVAQRLKDHYQVSVFEKETKPGGLVRCERINGSLFHTCGGHVFNSKLQEVLVWFWSKFDKDKEFQLTNRNSVIFLPNGQTIPYPIENFAYLLDENTQKCFIKDLIGIGNKKKCNVSQGSFQTFLLQQFGETLYHLYFEPYNKKVWRRELSEIPINWLEGKLPMPSVEEIIYNNFNRIAEKQFVHSTFYYEREGGSQLIADRLSEGIDVRYGQEIKQIQYCCTQWQIGSECYDVIVFCGNVKDLPKIIKSYDISAFDDPIKELQYHGTTSVFCEIDKNPYSWIYLPDENYEAHRIICTGNFAHSNNQSERLTATVEFTDSVSEMDIKRNLHQMPLHPKYITHKFNKFTYPIQHPNTREMIAMLKEKLASVDFFLTGRFADWEYYNMDVAIQAAMQTAKKINANVHLL